MYMIASSIEIARRGYKKFSKGRFCPHLDSLLVLGNQWKEDLATKFDSWVQIHNEIKNSKLKYRVLLEETILNAVFRLSSSRSYITCYTFI